MSKLLSSGHGLRRVARLLSKRAAALGASLAAVATPSVASALDIVPTVDPQVLVAGLGAQGVNVLNVQLTPSAGFLGAPPTGTYDDGPLGLPDGIILTSGAAINALPPNNASNTSGSFGTPADPLCQALAATNVNDSVRMTVQFTLEPGADGIAFDWLFGSEEYPEYVGQYNDSAGVFIRSDSGPGFGPFFNVLRDLQGNPVTINGPFFSGQTVIIPSAAQPITEYDGTTPHITTNHPLPGGPGVVHEMVIVICDALDSSYDSGLLIGGLRSCSGTCQSVAYCGDNLVNGNEDCDDGNNVNTDGCSNTCQGPDTDGDGVSDVKELLIGTDPGSSDTDGDQVDDGTEVGFDPLNPLDANGDSFMDALDPCFPNGQFCDPDFDGLAGTIELLVGTDPTSPDTDGDGIDDATELGVPSSPFDSDGDGVIDALESNVEDIDGDGSPAYLDPTEGDPCSPNVGSAGCDQDNDGLTNAQETALGTDPTNVDSDGDLTPDGSEAGDGSAPDSDGDGVIDALESATSDGDGDGSPDQNDPTNGDPCAPNAGAAPCDQDGDGLTNAQESVLGTAANDADSDDDGVSDGAEPNAGQDTDGDGLVNALDPDSDNDLLKDGTELGLGCNGPGTDTSAGNCVADADQGATVTNPLNPDTDNGGLEDGVEDANLDGVVGPGESDPGNSDDGSALDADGDGLPDAFEDVYGSDADDADSDDDGVPDGLEMGPLGDSDGDGLPNFVDADSDNDGLFDGTEMGYGCFNADTNMAVQQCIPDADMGATTTSPVIADTDGGGKKDGFEDWNHNGVVDPNEADPTWGHDGDDVSVVDSDGDGLSDGEEQSFGSDPFDNDSDDDGVLDGLESNGTGDADGDGLTNANDPDSDNDGIPDGTEMGLGCQIPGLLNCVPDGDDGATTTSALSPDSDGGGVLDGVEDKNHNGIVDPGEGDPNDPTDDVCAQNTDCVGGQAGLFVCDPTTAECVEAKCDGSLMCPPPDACHLAGMCDPTVGTCGYATKPDGMSCDDDNPCTIESCQGGACVAQSALDGTQCAGGVCIAGNCFLDSLPGTGGDGGEGGAVGGGGAGGAGSGAMGGAGGDGGGEGGVGADGEGGAGAAVGPGGAKKSVFTLSGGACSASGGAGGGSGRSDGGNGGLALLAAAVGLAVARRRAERSGRAR